MDKNQSGDKTLVIIFIIIGLAIGYFTYYATANYYEEKYKTESKEMFKESLKTETEYGQDFHRVMWNRGGDVDCNKLKIESNKVSCKAFQGEL